MTGHTSDEQVDIPQENRSTDSESATKFPTPQGGVVQDSPGTSASGVAVENDSELDDQGNYRNTDNSILETKTGEE